MLLHVTYFYMIIYIIILCYNISTVYLLTRVIFASLIIRKMSMWVVSYLRIIIIKVICQTRAHTGLAAILNNNRVHLKPFR